MDLLRTLVVALLFTLAVAGCAKEDYVGTRPDDEMEALTVSEALDDANLGRTIRVAGRVAAVCQEEGCWMTVTDDSSTVRIVFKDEDFVVPLSLSGTVVVEGVIREEIFDEESAKSVARSIGMDEQTIETLRGDQRLPLLTATGVLFVDE